MLSLPLLHAALTVSGALRPGAVVTRLDAKGAVDESHPLVMGVVGVHGKPGLAHAASVLEEASLVVAFGVGDLTVLLCDPFGLQVRGTARTPTLTDGSHCAARPFHLCWWACVPHALTAPCPALPDCRCAT